MSTKIGRGWVKTSPKTYKELRESMSQDDAQEMSRLRERARALDEAIESRMEYRRRLHAKAKLVRGKGEQITPKLRAAIEDADRNAEEAIELELAWSEIEDKMKVYSPRS